MIEAIQNLPVAPGLDPRSIQHRGHFLQMGYVPYNAAYQERRTNAEYRIICPHPGYRTNLGKIGWNTQGGGTETLKPQMSAGTYIKA